jgi:hypothetical protein
MAINQQHREGCGRTNLVQEATADAKSTKQDVGESTATKNDRGFLGSVSLSRSATGRFQRDFDPANVAVEVRGTCGWRSRDGAVTKECSGTCNGGRNGRGFVATGKREKEK